MRVSTFRHHPVISSLKGAFLLLLALAQAGCGGASQDTAPPPEPVAYVETVRARSGTLAETIIAYGTVIPAPGSVQSFAVPFESTVQQVLVGEGQEVGSGTPLVLVTPSPEARLQIGQAESALQAQQVVFDNTQQRFDLGLATSDDLAQQKQALADALAQYKKLQDWMRSGRLVAPSSGVVSQILVSEGSLVSAGSPLLNMALENRFEVRLGVEPEDKSRLRVGDAVLLTSVGTSEGLRMRGAIRSVAQQVSPDTRLVEVLIAPTAGTGSLLLNQFVRGAIEIDGTEGLIVPRSALLPQEDHYSLFTVRNGLANRHLVTIGVATDSLVQVRAPGLSDGDSVVVLGNYVLEDSMQVRTRSIPDTTAVLPAGGPR